MFQPAKSRTPRILEKLRPEAKEIEERSPGLRVLVARRLRYPVLQRELRVQVDTIRKLNLLEKYILRAATELNPCPRALELAIVLHLDVTFINLVCQELSKKGYLEVSTSGLISPTTAGKDIYSINTYSEEPDFQTWYYQQDPIYASSVCKRDRMDSFPKDVQQLDDLGSFLDSDLTVFPAFDKAQLTDYKELGLTCHDPDNDHYVTDLQPTDDDEICWRFLDLFVIYDELAENSDDAITLQLRAGTALLQELSQELMQRLHTRAFQLKEICGADLLEELASDANRVVANVDNQLAYEVDSRVERIRAEAKAQMRREKAGQVAPLSGGTVKQLRDLEIRDTFLRALKSATQRIIIYYPWMNEKTVDRELVSLLTEQVKKGVRVLIGYGISRNEQGEERPVLPRLSQSLHVIRTLEGTQGIVADWLGNSQAKEVIIDNTLYINGSPNWFSYRGDRYPRGEMVYEVTIPVEIAKAYEHLSGRFRQHVLDRWQTNANGDRRTALLTLCFLEEEHTALALLRQEQEYTLLLPWMMLVRQVLSTQTEKRLLSAIISLQKILRESEALGDEHRAEMQALCKRLSPTAQKTVRSI